MFLRISLLVCASLLASGMALSCAWAQANPNADQILNALTPRPGMSSGTRGIRPVAPGATAEPTPDASAGPPDAAETPGHPRSSHRAAHAATASDGGSPSVNLTVQFANGSAQLTPAAMRTLDELGRALANPRLAGDRFRIEGHTDTVGSSDSNKVLSDQRAQSVVAYLVDRFHVSVDKLQPVGMGEDGLLVATGPDRAEPRNRRVLVVNLGA